MRSRISTRPQNYPQALQANYLLAALRVRVKAASFLRLFGKAGFNPDQPRVPRGNPDGGQWTDTGASHGRVLLVNRTRGSRIVARIGGQFFEGTPDQIARLAHARSNAENRISEARRIDPGYRSPTSMFETIDGAIRHYEGQEYHALQHIRSLRAPTSGDNFGPRLGPLPTPGSLLRNPEPLIPHYREIIGAPPVPDGHARRAFEGTVAKGDVDGEIVFGVNSKSLGYTQADFEAAQAMRTKLIKSDPEIMQSRNTGWKPNNAFFHAEATLLLRAATKNGGTLAGKTITIRVDRNVCGSCEEVLPALSRQLGNPTIEILEPNDRVWFLADGYWIETPR